MIDVSKVSFEPFHKVESISQYKQIDKKIMESAKKTI